MKSSFVLPLLLLGAGGYGAMALAQSPGTSTATGNMTTPRTSHTANLLPNGKVLVAGGVRENRVWRSQYDTCHRRTLRFFHWRVHCHWQHDYAPHTATLFPDGGVLIAGGVREISGSGPTLILASAELYDPSTGAFTATGDMITARGCQGATLLTSGKVLIAGGTAPVAELYDPATGTFSPTGKYSS